MGCIIGNENDSRGNQDTVKPEKQRLIDDKGKKDEEKSKEPINPEEYNSNNPKRRFPHIIPKPSVEDKNAKESAVNSGVKKQGQKKSEAQRAPSRKKEDKNAASESQSYVPFESMFRNMAFSYCPDEVHLQNCNEMVHTKQKQRYNNPKDYNANIFKDISSDDRNIVKCVLDQRIELVECQTNESHRSIRLVIFNRLNRQVKVEIEAGQVFLPREGGSNAPTLCSRSTQPIIIPCGRSEHRIWTHCFDQEKRIPGVGEDYIISTLKPSAFKSGMNQDQVWSITFDEEKSQMKIQKKGWFN